MTGMSEGRFDDGLLWSLNVELKGAVSRPFDELTVFNIYTAVLNVSRPTGYSDKLSLSTVKVIQSQKGIK